MSGVGWEQDDCGRHDIADRCQVVLVAVVVAS